MWDGRVLYGEQGSQFTPSVKITKRFTSFSAQIFGHNSNNNEEILTITTID